MSIPDHLRPIEPAEAVHGLCDRIAIALGAVTGGGILVPVTWLELWAFRDSRTPHDARRLARALRHIEDRPELADEVLALAERRP